MTARRSTRTLLMDGKVCGRCGTYQPWSAFWKPGRGPSRGGRLTKQCSRCREYTRQAQAMSSKRRAPASRSTGKPHRTAVQRDYIPCIAKGCNAKPNTGFKTCEPHRRQEPVRSVTVDLADAKRRRLQAALEARKSWT